MGSCGGGLVEQLLVAFGGVCGFGIIFGLTKCSGFNVGLRSIRFVFSGVPVMAGVVMSSVVNEGILGVIDRRLSMCNSFGGFY